MSKKRKNDRPGHWRYKYEKKGLTLSILTEKIKKAVAGYLSAYLQKSVFQHSLLPDLWTQILKSNMVEQATCLQSKVNLL